MLMGTALTAKTPLHTALTAKTPLHMALMDMALMDMENHTRVRG